MFLVLLAWLAVATATASPAFDACVATALPAGDLHQVQAVRISAEDGWQRASEREVYWRRTASGALAALFVVTRPATEAGLKLLVTQDPGGDAVLHVYSPELGRARRVTGGGASASVLGTDFTFEDALHLQGFLTARDVVEEAPTTLDGDTVLVAERHPSADDSAYGRIRTLLDPRTCLPLRTEFFGTNGSLAKTLVIERADVVQQAGRFLPRRMTMLNHRERRQTEITALTTETAITLPEHLFTPHEIQRGP